MSVYDFIRLPDGRQLISGGKFLNTPAGVPPSGPRATTLALSPFKVGHSAAQFFAHVTAGAYTGDVWFPFTWTGTTPTNLEAQVVDAANTSSVVKAWAPIKVGSLSVNETTLVGMACLALVPDGGPYLLQLRDADQRTNAATTSTGPIKFGVGYAFALWGQSNQVGQLGAGSYGDKPPMNPASNPNWNEIDYFNGYGVQVIFGTRGSIVPTTTPGTALIGDGYTTGSDAQSTYAGMLSMGRMLAKALEKKRGKKVPVCLIPWAFNQNSIDNFLPTGDKYAGLFLGTGAYAGPVSFSSTREYWQGDLAGIAYFQGEADAGVGGMSRATYYSKLKQLYQAGLDYVAPFGRTASNFFFLMGVLGPYNSVSTREIEKMRSAVLDLDADAPGLGWPNVRAGWCTMDCDPADPNDGNPDALHFQDVPGGNPYKKWAVKRQTQGILKMVLPADTPFGGIGPRLIEAQVSHSGLTATIPVAHDGGTALAPRNTGAAVTGFLANTAADFTGTDIAVTATVAGPSSVSVAFPNGTVFPVYVKHCGGLIGQPNSEHPDVSNLLLDNVQYPFYPDGAGGNLFTGIDVFTGRPLLPTRDAIKVV